MPVKMIQAICNEEIVVTDILRVFIFTEMVFFPHCDIFTTVLYRMLLDSIFIKGLLLFKRPVDSPSWLQN